MLARLPHQELRCARCECPLAVPEDTPGEIPRPREADEASRPIGGGAGCLPTGGSCSSDGGTPRPPRRGRSPARLGLGGADGSGRDIPLLSEDPSEIGDLRVSLAKTLRSGDDDPRNLTDGNPLVPHYLQVQSYLENQWRNGSASDHVPCVCRDGRPLCRDAIYLSQWGHVLYEPDGWSIRCLVCHHKFDLMRWRSIAGTCPARDTKGHETSTGKGGMESQDGEKDSCSSASLTRAVRGGTSLPSWETRLNALLVNLNSMDCATSADSLIDGEGDRDTSSVIEQATMPVCGHDQEVRQEAGNTSHAGVEAKDASHSPPASKDNRLQQGDV